MLSPQASLSVGRAVVDDATAYCTGLYLEMLRNSLDLTVTYRAEGHGSRDGWHTYARSVETHGRPALSLTGQGKRPLPWAAPTCPSGHGLAKGMQ